jgi:hypothetical protein
MKGFNLSELNSIFYSNMLTQQLQEPITELVQENKMNTTLSKQQESGNKTNLRTCDHLNTLHQDGIHEGDNFLQKKCPNTHWYNIN